MTQRVADGRILQIERPGTGTVGDRGLVGYRSHPGFAEDHLNLANPCFGATCKAHALLGLEQVDDVVCCDGAADSGHGGRHRVEYKVQCAGGARHIAREISRFGNNRDTALTQSIELGARDRDTPLRGPTGKLGVNRQERLVGTGESQGDFGPCLRRTRQKQCLAAVDSGL